MDKSEIDSYVKAGEIAKQVKEFTRELIKPGMKLIDIAEAIDAKILELGGEFAFPVNLSLNEVAAHYTPVPGDETLAEGILKIDIGVAVDGFIADSAISLDLTEDGEFGGMIALNEEVLAAASEVVRVEMEARDVGEAIQDVMDGAGGDYAIIKSLSGHALGQGTIHAGLTISNYRNDNAAKLDDSAFAIEPFVTSGVGDIFEGKGGGIYVLNSGGQVRDRDARKVLEFVHKEYGTLPFCERWLAKAGFGRLKFILGILVKQGILHEYPVLIEKSRKPVSQVENTFLISDGKVTQTT
ncbi:type II methionyl aminopeptidase [archaeon]|jgi:methionyl aminopeptidase|nr:type II methionyl aminopeptidase [archaeon]MBT7128748.1 type II methionyl aminopeptidase [archaeon]